MNNRLRQILLSRQQIPPALASGDMSTSFSPLSNLTGLPNRMNLSSGQVQTPPVGVPGVTMPTPDLTSPRDKSNLSAGDLAAVNNILINQAKTKDSVSGINSLRKDVNQKTGGAFPGVPGGLQGSAAPLSGFNNESDYTNSLNDEDELLRIRNGGNLNVRSSRTSPLSSGNDSLTPNYDTPGEIGGKNQAAKMLDKKLSDETDQKNLNNKLAWTKETREQNVAQANVMHTNAETLRLTHPNFTFHNVDGKVTAFDPSDPNKKIVLGDANILSPDALEQKKQLALWNQTNIENREIDVNQNKVDNKLPPHVSPTAYATAHKQAIQDVLSDPTNAGLYTDITNQPKTDSIHPAEKLYSIKNVDDVNNDPMKLRLYTDLMNKITDRTNTITGVGKQSVPGDKELGSINDDDLSDLSSTTKPKYKIEKIQ